MSEEQTWQIVKGIIILLICLITVRIIVGLFVGGVSGGTTNRFHTAHQSSNQITSKNWTPCRICKQPVNTDSYDVANWFCTSCQKVRDDLLNTQSNHLAKTNATPKPLHSSQVELERIREFELNELKKERKSKSIIQWNEDGSIKDA